MKRVLLSLGVRSHRMFRTNWLKVLPTMLLSSWLPSLAVAAPLLRCQIDQGGNTRVLDFAVVSDPYTVPAIDINGRFRFKAVMIGEGPRVDYIKLYVYSQTKRQPVLLHLAKYQHPALPKGEQPTLLTGINYLYSPQLERELKYSCSLLEKAS